MKCLSAWLVALLAATCACGDGKIRLIAHRGGVMEADENTVDAFVDAYSKGLRAFETDVRMTKDGQLVLMHDDQVDRTTNGHGEIELMTAAQVRQLTTRRSERAVPFLCDFLNAFTNKPGVFLQLEVKPGNGPVNEDRLDRFAQTMTALVAQTLPSATVCYSSFDRRSLAAIRRNAPKASLTLLVNGEPDIKLLATLKELDCDRVSVLPKKAKPAFVEAARKAGFRVAGWSVRTDDDLTQAQTLGLESVTTDCPRRMLANGLGTP